MSHWYPQKWKVKSHCLHFPLKDSQKYSNAHSQRSSSVCIHDIHLHVVNIGLQLFADTMSFCSSFVGRGEKKNFKTLSLWWILILRVTSSKSRTEQLFTMARSTSCQRHFSSLKTTHYTFSSSAFAQLQKLTFSQGDVSSLCPYTSIPQRFGIYLYELQHENFSPGRA